MSHKRVDLSGREELRPWLARVGVARRSCGFDRY